MLLQAVGLHLHFYFILNISMKYVPLMEGIHWKAIIIYKEEHARMLCGESVRM